MDLNERERLREKWRYEDKYPDDCGMLLSDKIHELCEVGLLISSEYAKGNLRPASYTLRIGDSYINSDGKRRTLTDEEDSFIFKKNSIVFVSTKEELDLPFYIVARFNIRVTWVYDGVLLGTGPQVDPGYRGYLSCPLYNLTNLDIRIKRGEDFATIDFEKTTRLPMARQPEELRKVIEAAQDKRNTQADGRTFSFYKRRPLKQLDSCKGHQIVSSLIEMKDDVRTWRRLGIGSVIAFFGLTLSLLGFGVNLYRQNANLLRQLTDTQNEIRDADERITVLEKTVDRLSGGKGAPSVQPRSSKAAPLALPKDTPPRKHLEKGSR